MPSEEAATTLLAKYGRRAAHDLRFRAAGIGEQNFGRQRGAKPGNQVKDTSHRRGQNNDLAATDGIPRISVALIDCALLASSLEHRGPIAADNASQETLLF